MTTLTVTEAAAVIGCNPSHLRRLIRRGRIPATLTQSPIGNYYTLAVADVRRYANKPQSRGWPRGVSRKPK
jgi:excisionase family DNA binding protein